MSRGAKRVIINPVWHGLCTLPERKPAGITLALRQTPWSESANTTRGKVHASQDNRACSDSSMSRRHSRTSQLRESERFRSSRGVVPRKRNSFVASGSSHCATGEENSHHLHHTPPRPISGASRCRHQIPPRAHHRHGIGTRSGAPRSRSSSGVGLPC